MAGFQQYMQRQGNGGDYQKLMSQYASDFEKYMLGRALAAML